MNYGNPQLEALERIIINVRRFRADPQNQTDKAYTSELDLYLQQHLSKQDWQLWKSLQLDWQESESVFPPVGV